VGCEVSELRRLLAEATPGPWEVGDDRVWGNADDVEPETLVYLIELASPTANSALIVAAFNALPALLDVVDAARVIEDPMVAGGGGDRWWAAHEALRDALRRLDGAS